MNSSPIRNFESIHRRLQAALNPVGGFSDADTVTLNGRDYPLIKIVLGAGNPKRVLLSGGIHGNEPAGVEALCAFLEKRLYQDFLSEWEFTFLPCINPSGYEAGTRNNQDDIDLNRKFKDAQTPAEVAFVKKMFATPYHLDLELHEDVDSPGYYLYQKDKSAHLSALGRIILDRVEQIHPLNLANEIEEMEAERGLLSRLTEPDEMEWWPMAMYAHHRGCNHALTLEASPALPMEQRVNAHLEAIQAALKFLADTDEA